MRLYLDHAATTSLDPRVFAEMQPLLREPLNSSSIHQSGQRARRLLERARERLAVAVGCPDPAHVVFTSGASEGANLVMRGLAAALGRTPQLALSELEHPCVRETAAAVAGEESLGRIPVAANGRAQLQEAMVPCDLLCLMHSNNETGTIQDVATARRWREKLGGAWLCDAAQSPGKTRLDLADLGADAVLLSAHKVHGPPGIGAVVGSLVEKLSPQITGGPQENGRRAGTAPVALAVGFARAMELAAAELDAHKEYAALLQSELLNRLDERGIEWQLNGDAPRAAGVMNLSFPGKSATDLVIALDQLGIDVSPGSACSTGVVAPSRVLTAMFPDDPGRAGGGIRICFGRETPSDAPRRVCDALCIVLQGPRAAPGERRVSLIYGARR